MNMYFELLHKVDGKLSVIATGYIKNGWFYFFLTPHSDPPLPPSSCMGSQSVVLTALLCFAVAAADRILVHVSAALEEELTSLQMNRLAEGVWDPPPPWWTTRLASPRLPSAGGGADPPVQRNASGGEGGGDDVAYVRQQEHRQ
jgi:hypothetical protein